MSEAQDVLRVSRDDPEYLHTAQAEAAFWQEIHPFAAEMWQQTGPVDVYVNQRFTGDRNRRWFETIARHGVFRRGLTLGTSALDVEAHILEANPTLYMTFLDLSEGALARRAEALGPRFPQRVATQVADLNFIELPAEMYDLIVSAGTIHHVTNLEHLAYQINRSLTAGGYFFLYDYVGESRYDFSLQKRRLFELLYNREIARQSGRQPGVHWCDTSDLSPFCGVRSGDTLDVFRRYLTEIELHTASALLVPLLRSRPADGGVSRTGRWRALLQQVSRLAGFRKRNGAALGRNFLDELFLVSDLVADAGLLKPGIAFAIYQKRTRRSGTAA